MFWEHPLALGDRCRKQQRVLVLLPKGTAFVFFIHVLGQNRLVLKHIVNVVGGQSSHFITFRGFHDVFIPIFRSLGYYLDLLWRFRCQFLNIEELGGLFSLLILIFLLVLLDFILLEFRINFSINRVQLLPVLP